MNTSWARSENFSCVPSARSPDGRWHSNWICKIQHLSDPRPGLSGLPSPQGDKLNVVQLFNQQFMYFRQYHTNEWTVHVSDTLITESHKQSHVNILQHRQRQTQPHENEVRGTHAVVLMRALAPYSRASMRKKSAHKDLNRRVLYCPATGSRYSGPKAILRFS